MKYIKLNSVTWWSSVVPLLAGLFLLTTPLHGAVGLAALVSSYTGGAEPMILINAGLAGIGFRAAIP